MKKIGFVILLSAVVVYGCAPLQSITRHDLSPGYYNLTMPGKAPEKVYADLIEDSITIYKMVKNGSSSAPDPTPAGGVNIRKITPGSYLYGSTFTRNSLDLDLSTVALKYRPVMSGVPNQLSYNVNALFYLGFRRDRFMIKTHQTPIKYFRSNVVQVGFDAGLFAGFGITPLNPTVTANRITQEYDGFFLQKGIAAFLTVDQMSVGLSVGFDNLLDKNSVNWIYNRKPWIGIILGIANF